MLPVQLKPSRQQQLVNVLGRVILVLVAVACAIIAYQSLFAGKGSSPIQPHGLTPKPGLSPQKLAELAAALDPPLYTHMAPKELEEPRHDLKNPCFRTGDGLSQLRCLPYAYILGGFQCGAGTLYQKLAAHPDIIITGSSRNQFWAEQAKSPFQFAADHTRASLQENPNGVILEGSASTFGFYWSAALRTHMAFQRVIVPCVQNCTQQIPKSPERQACLDQKCYPEAMAADLQMARSLGVQYDDMHLPALLRAAYGPLKKPKLIVLIRDPVERLHSAFYSYAHYAKYGRNPEGFLSYVKEQVGAIKDCAARQKGKVVDGQPLTAAQAERHCVLYFEALGSKEESVFFHADQIIRGVYSVFLEVWMRYFTLNEDLLVIKTEEYIADQDKTLKEVYAFLGLQEPADPSVSQKIKSLGGPNPNKEKRPAMLPAARQTLLDFYRPYIKDLAALLNDKKWLAYGN